MMIKDIIFPESLHVSLRANFPLLIICSGYAFVIFIFAHMIDAGDHFSLFTYSSLVGFTLGSGASAIFIAKWAKYNFTDHDPAPLKTLLKNSQIHLKANGGILNYILPLLLLSILVSSFTTFKTIFPETSPFQWDRLFYEWDKVLHFGTDPWVLTHSIFGGEIATLVINWLYNMWFGFMWLGVCVAILLTNQPRLRAQFLISFALCWIILGTIGASTFSSAGPVYFAHITGDAAPFEDLLTRLRAIDQNLEAQFGLGLMALDLQDMLWLVHTSDENILGGGISAMPSMHVSIATLLAIGAFQINCRLGAVFAFYALCIQIGSVHLAWHYALDGYVSILVTACIWATVGLFVKNAYMQPQEYISYS